MHWKIRKPRTWPGITGKTTKKPMRNLSLCFDFVAKDKVGGQPEDDEENTQNDEVYVELCIFHIQ